MEGKYKNIIFDLGGVMIEWDPPAFLQELELPPHFTEVFHSLLWACHDGGLLTREEVLKKLPQHYDKEVFSHCINKLAPNLKPIPGMIELFHDVRRMGYRVYILSNMPREMHLELLDLHDFFKYSDGHVYSYEIGAIKPQPQIYEALLAKYRLYGPESIFIDNREENVHAASKFGIEGIIAQNPNQVRHELLRKGVFS